MDDSTLPAVKVCARCEVEKAASEYYLVPRRRRAGGVKLHSWCKECVLAYNRKGLPPEQPCAHCGTVFKPTKVTNRWCSRRCYLTWRNRQRGILARNSVVDGMKLCPKCGVRKPVEEFYRRLQRASGFSSECRPCTIERHRERAATGVTRNNKYVSQYGVTLEWYEQKLREQDGRCAICRREPPSNKRLAVDHCHAGGTVRELLCDHCNIGLGHFQDDPELLTVAIAYLTRHKSHQAA